MAEFPPPATHFNVVNDIPECGLSAQDATTFATEIFMDDFQTCREIPNKGINYPFKNFSTLSVEQG